MTWTVFDKLETDNQQKKEIRICVYVWACVCVCVDWLKKYSRGIYQDRIVIGVTTVNASLIGIR
jgi:hypothetical protein